MLLEHLRDAVSRLDAGAGDEAVIVFLAESRLRHLTDCKRRGLLTAEKDRLGTGAVAAAVLRLVQTFDTKVEISGTILTITPSVIWSPSWKIGLVNPLTSRGRASLLTVARSVLRSRNELVPANITKYS
jgi:hypothetical protein